MNKITNTIFGKMFWLNPGNFQKHAICRSTYREEFDLQKWGFYGTLDYNFKKIGNHDTDIWNINSQIIIKSIHSKIEFNEYYNYKHSHLYPIEKHLLVISCPKNIMPINIFDLPTGLLQLINNKSDREIKSFKIF